jgi:transmembrane sensor
MTDPQDLMQQIANAGARMDPGLSDRDVDRLVEGVGRRRRRRTLRRIALAGAAAACVVFMAAVQLQWLPSSTQPPAIARGMPALAPTSPIDRTVRLPDGSSAMPLDSGSEIAILVQTPAHVGLSLSRGSGRFEVAPRPERTFSVRAGDVTITVVGTAFSVERIADRVGVSVERGTVRVEWGLGSRLLTKGQSGWFPPLAAATVPEPKEVRRPVLPVVKVGKARTEEASPSPASAKAESAEDLLLAADSMRMAGHPAQGAEFLRRILREHHEDPRAPLAAFTLGRVLLMEMGRPQEAAAAFAEVRRLSPGGAFAEDALAREVEAWSQAGQPDRAQARAREYLHLYPGGRRAATVRSLGGIE